MARQADAVVLAEDGDFAEAVRRLGAPPAVVWTRVDNTSTASMKQILEETPPSALDTIRGGFLSWNSTKRETPRGPEAGYGAMGPAGVAVHRRRGRPSASAS